MSIDGNVFINPLTYCDLEVELANAEREMVMQTVKVGYYRSRITTAFFDAFVALPSEAAPADVKEQFYPMFLHLVGWWNVRRDEAMWPLTAVDIEPMDAILIWQLLVGVLRHNKEAMPGEAARGKPRPAPLSTISEPEMPASSQADASPSNMSILPSRTPGRASSPGTGPQRPKATSSARRSGSQRRSG